MEKDYIFYSSIWVKLIDANIVNWDPIYWLDTVDPTKRIKIERDKLTRQTDSWTWFVDVESVSFQELTASEQYSVVWELENYITAYSDLYEIKVEKNIHLSLVQDFINSEHIKEYTIISIPWSSCCNLFYSAI